MQPDTIDPNRVASDMTARHMHEAIGLLFGHNHAAMARAVSRYSPARPVDARAVSRWASGTWPIPQWAKEATIDLLKGRGLNTPVGETAGEPRR